MELGQEELFVSNDQASHMMMIKGKRTKRPRPQSPPNGVAVTSSSSSACGGNTGAINGGDNNQEYNFYGMMNSSSFTTTSPTTSGEIYESTEEEEDMANCLILLAQGHDHVSTNRKQLIEERISQNENMGLGKAGFFVYECKTCTRTFPSFQALGGHRASHKKPKSTITTEDQKKPTPPPPPPAPTHVITSSSSAFDEFEDQTKQPNIKYKSSPVASIPSQIGNKPKIHECSICGSEFTSGQALGGHMRRHRSAATAAATNSNHAAGTSTKLERNVLPLDLNLPAPEDYDHHHHHQHRDSKFQFVPTQQTNLVFNAPALVDCHY